MKNSDSNNRAGLVLTGGGARAAYQVGVLKAMAEWSDDDMPCPFPILTGTSAGSINTLLIASRAHSFRESVDHLVAVWSNLSVSKVFRTDTATMLRTSARWLLWLALWRHPKFAPPSVLDNTPLRQLLELHMRFPRIEQSIANGDLDAVAVTAAGYTSARSVTFFEGRRGLVSWSRTRRDGVMVDITLDHLMASVALPILFPAQRIGAEYFGDGSMRQAAPLSPAIHLGAEKLLVIGTRNEDANPVRSKDEIDYPTFGEIGGYILDSLFMDALYTDIERLRRINELVRQIGRKPHGTMKPLREIDVSVMVPSKDVRDIAARHLKRMPRTVRILLRLLGATGSKGAQLLSYLLFDGAFCREMIDLGYRDAHDRRHVLAPFLGLDEAEIDARRRRRVEAEVSEAKNSAAMRVNEE